MCKNWGIWCIPKYLGNIWGIYGVILCIPKYLGNIWGIYGEYLGNEERERGTGTRNGNV